MPSRPTPISAHGALSLLGAILGTISSARNPYVSRNPLWVSNASFPTVTHPTI